VIEREPKTMFAMGVHGQHLFVDRAKRLVIAKFSSQDQPVDAPAVGLTLQGVSAIRRCLDVGA
jgi:CubicO group peptidase (beta-lactamase class C family)